MNKKSYLLHVVNVVSNKITKSIVMKSLAQQLKIQTVLSRGHHCE